MTLLKLDYSDKDASIVFSWEGEGPWVKLRNAFIGTPDTRFLGGNTFFVRWSDFLLNWESKIWPILENLYENDQIEISRKIEELLDKSNERRISLDEASSPLLEEEIQQTLLSFGWGKGLPDNKIRNLTKEQIRNVAKMSSLQCAADFSVPGAGKTTEALAFLTLKQKSAKRGFLVIAPLSAFSAWEEDVKICLGPDEEIIRLKGKNIESNLRKHKSKKMIISYDQAARPESLNMLVNYLSENSSPLILDESHRIKNGASLRARCAYHLSPLASEKLILTGTPMPQDSDDLISQYNFLFPERPILESERVLQEFRPIFVRTSKDELGLTPLKVHDDIYVRMNSVQREVYDLLREDLIRRRSGFKLLDRAALRSLGLPILRLLKFISNPSLIANDLGEISDDAHNLAQELLEEGNGPKVEETCSLTRKLVSKGEKVLIWSCFRRNVEIISEELNDCGSLWIHGGVKSGNEEDAEVREGIIKKFKEDKETRVLVLNPAASGEGISLHQVCHNAIYNDRTFNAAHYIQSQDRIHRLGLPKNIETNIFLIQLADSPDQGLHQRVSYKLHAMNEFLSSNNIEPNPDYWDETLADSTNPDVQEEISDADEIISLKDGGVDKEDASLLFDILDND